MQLASVPLVHGLLIAQWWLSATVRAQTASTTTSSVYPDPTACGDIFDTINLDPYQNSIYFASDVYECLLTVPFLDVVALRYIDYYNYTIQFQSTLAYLKSPPSGYQQPAIDVEGVLTEIRQNVTAGSYLNQYDFEVTLQQLVQRMHDGHVSLNAGALSAFTFGSPYSLMSVSVDGIQVPKVYIAEDVVEHATSGGILPSAIQSINGVDVIQYLTQFALNYSYGYLEPDADWNNLMYSPVQDISLSYDLFGRGATWYPGNELNITFENGTTLPTYYLAYYFTGENTGPLTTGGDYYNYFVLGNIPASYSPPPLGVDNNSTSNSTNSTAVPSWYSVSPAYPQQVDIAQEDLSIEGRGVLTGYFLRNITTGVLSIPTFSEDPDASQEFSDTVAAFITGAKAAGMTKILIDLQGNYGGNIALAFDTFNQFFPNIDPFAGSRRRDFAQENILGNAMTNFWSSLYPGDPDYDYDYFYEGLVANEWVITDRLNAATGRNFSSWQEYYNPTTSEGDIFSQTERYNLSSPLFDYVASGGVNFTTRPITSPPWSGQNVIILTDAICGSTCALFTEMMNYEADVRSVVVGGRPSTGPMQAASGGRGARSFDANSLDDNIAFVQAVNHTANVTLPQVRDQAIYTDYLGFNLRDQLRRNNPTPLQFQYLAADCRIYYTFANAYNMERLWRDATAAVYTNSSLCVAGSTGFSTTGNVTSPKPPPVPSNSSLPFHGFLSYYTTHQSSIGVALTDGRQERPSDEFHVCAGSCTCPINRQTNVPCKSGKSIKVCGDPCRAESCARGNGICVGFSKAIEQKVTTKGGSKSANVPDQKVNTPGYCKPKDGNSLPACNPGGQPSVPQNGR